ncbi:hypothetical protein Tco_0257692 [Tanacetum coccineum]
MDDPNITMEEYIRLEEEKARRRGKRRDKSKSNKKNAKNGDKTGHGNRSAKRKPWDQKPKPRKGKTKGNSKLKGGLDYSSDHKHDGRVRFVKSSTLIGSLKLRGYAAGRKAQEMLIFTLKALTQQKQGHIKGLPAWQSM